MDLEFSAAGSCSGATVTAIASRDVSRDFIVILQSIDLQGQTKL
jgi:hypothetical protein